jgi:hypothetical protein
MANGGYSDTTGNALDFFGAGLQAQPHHRMNLPGQNLIGGKQNVNRREIWWLVDGQFTRDPL